MNGKPNPTENFLISTIASLLGGLVRPMWYVIRSDMGIQHTALIPVLLSGAIAGAASPLLSWASEINRKVIILYVVLIVVGYFRNSYRARRRRRTRDWGVSTWSSGESLFVPVLLFACRRIYQRWGGSPTVRRLVSIALDEDFVYYVAEPGSLVLVGVGLWSIGSTAFYYPMGIALILMIVRNDAKLWLYLKAAEIPDGKRLESAVKWQLDGPEQGGNYGTVVAQIPQVATANGPTGGDSVYDRLSPELQMLLAKDRYTHVTPQQ
jgi:hypothetical protein